MNAALQPAPFVPGIQSRIPFDEYRAMAGINGSLLKELRHSPQMFAFRKHNPKVSKSLTFGQGGHCAVLEPERFDTDYAVWERRTDSGNLAPRNGQHWDRFRAEHPNQTILTADEYAKTRTLQAAIRSNVDAMRYLDQAGDPEVTMQALLFGRQCKGRLDWLCHDWEDPSRPALVGLKTARDCRPRQFGRQAFALGYHISWAFYLDLYKAITSHPNPKVVEIVVESEPPHAVTVYVIPDDVLQLGFDEYTTLLAKLDECERADQWPGPSAGEHALALPSYAYGDEEITYVDE